jgi:hypothetical protein
MMGRLEARVIAILIPSTRTARDTGCGALHDWGCTSYKL